MKNEVNYTFNQKLILSQRDPFLLNNLFVKATPANKKEPILFNHKSSLEVLLKILKDFQLNYLSLNSKKIRTKQMLLSLKDKKWDRNQKKEITKGFISFFKWNKK